MYKNEHNLSDIYVSTFKGEVEFIAGYATKAGNIETGGGVYGLLTHAKRLVIMFIAGPGKNAIQKHSQFCDDLLQLEQDTNFLWDNFGIQFLGTHHSHHLLHHQLSYTDHHSAFSTAAKLKRSIFVQLLVSFRSPAMNNSMSLHPQPSGNRFSRLKHRILGDNDTYSIKSSNTENFDNNIHLVKISAHIYTDPQNKMLPIRVPIKVIPGESPIRSAINRRRGSHFQKKVYYFPFSRILLDNYIPHQEAFMPPKDLLSRLGCQLACLPSVVRKNAKFIFNRQSIFIALPVFCSTGTVIVIYANEIKCKPCEVYHSDTGDYRQAEDISKISLRSGAQTNLKRIYRIAATYANKAERNTHIIA